MKTLIIWLLMLHDAAGDHIVWAHTAQSPCTETADKLNAQVGKTRGLHWTCDQLKVERN